MPDELIIRHCSPTLAGLKTANLFSYSFNSKKNMNDKIRDYNSIFKKKGLRMIPLRYEDNRGLIYIYRPSKLSKDLNNKAAVEILERIGYKVGTTGECIVQLINRLKDYEEFPHEIGLFLGYPPEDVCGFIENKACGCKCVGCWKVYGNENEAKKTFAKYKKCTDVYSKSFEKDKSIEKLIVSI